TVEEGQVLAVMEAMKMEAQVLAPVAGVLRQEVAAGAFVEADVPLGRIEGMRRT
ncbi:MAG: acetyl-CoA carboxylase biotin carboxyl carrier protein subunit, partial [Castellaniella sp.]